MGQFTEDSFSSEADKRMGGNTAVSHSPLALAQKNKPPSALEALLALPASLVCR